MSSKIYETKQKGESDTLDSAAKLLSSLSGDVVNVLRILGVQVESLINLAKYNPQFGAVIGIIANDLLAHRVDFVKWQHQELICLDCANLTVQPNQTVVDQNGGILGTLINGFLQFSIPGQVISGIISTAQFFATHNAGTPGGGPGPGSTSPHQTAYVWIPGIITQSANLIITGIIVASFGISAAGAIIGDITAITKLVGNSPDPTSLVKPTPPNVEAGSQIKTNQTFTKGLGPEGT